MSARLKKGDLVVVISGKDKGKQGKIAKINHEDMKVVVEGVNLVKKHLKPTARNQSGGILEREQAIFSSKVMLVDPKTGKGTRVHMKTDAKGHKVRVGKSGEEIHPPKRAESDEKK
jgi:large subunit ribosomal protein L24